MALILAQILLSSRARSDSNEKVLDLGQLDVEGQVRRPTVEWIDSQKSARDRIPNLYIQEFARVERELLDALREQKNEK
jgi:hypothetical protein